MTKPNDNDTILASEEKENLFFADEIKRLTGALEFTLKFIADMKDVCYGENLMVSGWHLNDDLEPLDNFFDSNINWDELSKAQQALNPKPESSEDEVYKSCNDSGKVINTSATYMPCSDCDAEPLRKESK